MKGILIKATGELCETQFSDPWWDPVREMVHGTPCPILSKALTNDYAVLVCDHQQRLPLERIKRNKIASYLCNRNINGDVVIVGNSEAYGINVKGLNDMDVQMLAMVLSDAEDAVKEKATLQCG